MMAILILSLLILFAIFIFHFGFWRFFFVCIGLGSLPFIPYFVHTLDHYIVVAFLLYGFILLTLTCRTFFIHGVYRKQKIGNHAFTHFLWKCVLGIWMMIVLLFFLYLFYENIVLGTTHLILSFFPFLMISIIVAVLLSVLTWITLIILVNQYVVKASYVVDVHPGKLQTQERLRKWRYFGKENSVQLYAKESVYGVVYYYRKARANDYTITYDNALTRFFERFEADFNQEKTLLTTMKKAKHTFILLGSFCLMLFCFSNYVNDTPALKLFINEKILAPHYKTTIGKVQSCGEVERHQTSGKVQRTYYTLDCKVKYHTVTTNFQFERRSALAMEKLKGQILEEGFPIHYHPELPRIRYTEIASEGNIQSVLLFYVTAGFFLYRIFCLLKERKMIKKKRVHRKLKK